jgi:hypothetical protein
MSEIVDGISKALNTTYKTEDIKKNLPVIKQTINEVAEVNKNPDRLVLEDKIYLRDQLKTVIETMQASKSFLENEITRPPAHSGLIQAFSILCEQLVNAIKELRVLNMDIINTELAQRRLEQNYQIKTGNTTNNIQNNVYMLDSKSLDEMIKNAEQNRKIDMIDVDFEQDTQIK